MRKIVTILCCLMALLSACDSFFDPKLTNNKGEQQLIDDPNIIRGFITFAYRSIPLNYDAFGSDFLDCATDNALTNNLSGSMNLMSGQNGYWTDISNPLDNWNASYENIRSLNDFIERGLGEDIVYIRSNAQENADYRNRLKGEVYFLRAWIQFDLLRRFSGIDTEGKLMGFPIITQTMSVEKIEMRPRNTFDECVKQILDDITVALSAGLKDKYEGDNAIWGATNLGRPTTVACKALKSRVLLYAASPAYNLHEDAERYKQAAQAAKDVIDMIGTTLPDIYKVDNISAIFYNNDDCDELILRRVAGNETGDLGMETRHFAPAVGLIGAGKCNPSQNLVDAFPMANGYPIDHPDAQRPADMYAERDPRLAMTILHNGSVFKGVEIQTYSGGNCMPGATGVTDQNSTRTGYFLRKWISSKVNLISGNTITDYHYYAMFRKVEAFLNFAEAANFAYGPDDKTLGMSAREAIAEVRRRAGLASAGDPYLYSLNTKDELEGLIKNERRIELCFENHRFFDLRRWKEGMNESVKGITFSGPDDKEGRVTVVQTPVYRDYMIYGPIPNAERMKCPAITQNQGW